MTRYHPFRALSIAVVLAQGSIGCKSKSTAVVEDRPGAVAAPSASAPKAPVQPLSELEIQAALNPKGLKPYSGPIGTVRGVVRVSGGGAPELPDVLRQMPPGKCADARAFYGKVFREGPARELGDVLVGVTDYQGYVPTVSPVKTVVIRGCAFESRTIALVFGQRLDIRNRGGETFIPRLVGAKQASLQVAVPGGDAVQLFPGNVGQYKLADQTHDFATADVFVLKFPTFAVTGIDGKFEISGVPVGEVTVSARLPATGRTATAKANVVAGETANIDFTLPFDEPAPGSSAK